MSAVPIRLFRRAVIACALAAPPAAFSLESTVYVALRPAVVNAARFEHTPSDADAPLDSRACIDPEAVSRRASGGCGAIGRPI